MKEENPIMAELYATREKIAKELNYDVKALGKYLQSISRKDCEEIIAKAVAAEARPGQKPRVSKSKVAKPRRHRTAGKDNAVPAKKSA